MPGVSGVSCSRGSGQLWWTCVTCDRLCCRFHAASKRSREKFSHTWPDTHRHASSGSRRVQGAATRRGRGLLRLRTTLSASSQREASRPASEDGTLTATPGDRAARRTKQVELCVWASDSVSAKGCIVARCGAISGSISMFSSAALPGASRHAGAQTSGFADPSRLSQKDRQKLLLKKLCTVHWPGARRVRHWASSPRAPRCNGERSGAERLRKSRHDSCARPAAREQSAAPWRRVAS